jgi:hypothetical protein
LNTLKNCIASGRDSIRIWQWRHIRRAALAKINSSPGTNVSLRPVVGGHAFATRVANPFVLFIDPFALRESQGSEGAGDQQRSN